VALIALQAWLSCAQGSSAQNTTSIRIAEIQFADTRQLTPSEFESINRRYQGRTVIASDIGNTLSEMVERTKDVYQQRGYFKAVVSPAMEYVSVEGDQRNVRISLNVQEGGQYRLKEVLWTGNTVFSDAELQATMPISPDEIFNTAKIRKSLEDLRRLYGQRGYINFTPIPETTIDDNSHTVTLSMDLDEGKQFRIAKVEFLGLSTDVRQKLISDWNLNADAPYDTFYVEKFFLEHQSLLPPGARPDADIEVIRNEKAGTVDLIWDFSDN
jgi:outer membrane protein insertion porin family